MAGGSRFENCENNSEYLESDLECLSLVRTEIECEERLRPQVSQIEKQKSISSHLILTRNLVNVNTVIFVMCFGGF